MGAIVLKWVILALNSIVCVHCNNSYHYDKAGTNAERKQNNNKNNTANKTP